MSIIAALLAYPIGATLGIVLVLNLITVLGLTSLAPPVAAIPGIGPAVAAVVSVIGVGTELALTLNLLLILLVVFLSYATASFGVTVPVPTPGLQSGGLLELAGRGLLIGINCGLNHILLLSVMGATATGFLVASVFALINFLAAVPQLSNNSVYQTVLAYTTLFLPMSLLLNLLGILFLTFNMLFMLLVPLDWFAEWRRANFVTYGGVTHVDHPSGYNLANFTLLDRTWSLTDPWITPAALAATLGSGPNVLTGSGVVFHEAAHTLNAGAFGWLYHLIGWADEFLPMPWSPTVRRGADAHAELCAESGLRDIKSNWLDMWTPSFAPPAAANRNALAAVTLTPGAGVVLGAFDPAAGTMSISCERNRTVTLDSSGSSDPDAFPEPLGRLWVFRNRPGGPGVPEAIATGTVTATVNPTVGGRFDVEFWITDGVNGGPLPAPGATNTIFDLPFAIDIDAVAAVINPPAVLPPVGNPVSFTSVGSTGGGVGAGAIRSVWLVTAAPPASNALGRTDGGTVFTFDLDAPTGFTVSLTVSCDVVDVSGATVALSDTTTFSF